MECAWKECQDDKCIMCVVHPRLPVVWRAASRSWSVPGRNVRTITVSCVLSALGCRWSGERPHGHGVCLERMPGGSFRPRRTPQEAQTSRLHQVCRNCSKCPPFVHKTSISKILLLTCIILLYIFFLVIGHRCAISLIISQIKQ